MTFERMSPAAVTTAAQVSSQLVSRPRITARSAADGALAGGRVGVRDVVQQAVAGGGGAPHDERVLPVVLVVAAARAGAAEPVALVEVDRRVVGLPDLERVLRVLPRLREQLREQRRGDPPAP